MLQVAKKSFPRSIAGKQQWSHLWCFVYLGAYLNPTFLIEVFDREEKVDNR